MSDTGIWTRLRQDVEGLLAHEHELRRVVGNNDDGTLRVATLDPASTYEETIHAGRSVFATPGDDVVCLRMSGRLVAVEVLRTDGAPMEIAPGLALATRAEAEDPISTTARLISGQRLAQAVSANGRVIDVRAHGATGSTSNETAQINAAVDAAKVAIAGGSSIGVRLSPGSTHIIGRRVPGQQRRGGIRIYPQTELDGAGATLRLSETDETTVAFVTNQWPTDATDTGDHFDMPRTAITGNVGVGSTQYNVASTTGFIVGDWVFVRYGDNVWDDAETLDHMYAKVLTVDSATLITLDRPSARALTVAGVTGAINGTIQKLAFAPDGVRVHDLSLINTAIGTAYAAYGLDIRYTRGTVVENIEATNPGPGLMFAYPEDLVVRNVHIHQSDKQGGLASNGRGLNMWNAKNARFENIRIEKFETNAIFFESYCRNVTVDGLRIVNNHPARSNTPSTPLIVVGQDSETEFRNVIVEGNGGSALVSSGGTSHDVTFENLSIQTATQLAGLHPLNRVSGTLRIKDKVFRSHDVRRVTVPFRLDKSMSAVPVMLPSGLIRSLKAFVSTTTGVTAFTPVAHGGGSSLGNAVAQLVAGGIAEIANANNWGSNYPFNSDEYPQKRIDISTDATVPSLQYGYVEVEYYPMNPNTKLPDPNDASGLAIMGRVANAPAYSTPNIAVPDRTYDANATTIDEIADVLGTLIADLKVMGWVK